MPTKSIKLEGYGTIMISPVKFVDKDYETVDSTGKPLTTKTIGERAKTVYVNSDGVEIPRSDICKKVELDGEEIILPKFSITKEVAKSDIEEIEDNSAVYNAIERKVYHVVTDSDKLKELLKSGKTLRFAAAFGSGWKGYNTLLTRWKDQIVLVGCRGDLTKELDKFSEDTVDIEVEVIPQNMKKVVKAMVM